jgi:hypothetical protein
LVFRQPPVSLTVQSLRRPTGFFEEKRPILRFAHRERQTAHSGTPLGSLTCNTTMTVRVDTLDALISGSSSRAIPFVRSLSAALLDRLASWRQQRSTLVMSDEWLQEYRWSNRDQH